MVRNEMGNRGSNMVKTGFISGLRQTEVLGIEGDTYRIRALFYTREGAYQGFGDIVVFLKIDGDEFEIVGHALPGDERPEQAAAQATDPAEPSGEFSGN